MLLSVNLCAQVGQDGCYDFHSCSCQLAGDELEAAGHIVMELIPAPPTSADHTLFMSSLKESCARDHVISRRDDTRVKGDEHTRSVPVAACALDENASPDPHPTPTMVFFSSVCSYFIRSSFLRLQDHPGAAMDHYVSVYWMVRGVAHPITCQPVWVGLH